MEVQPPQVPQTPAPAGPPGTQRNIATSIVLAIVTLGIYTFVWTFKTHDELKKHTGDGLGGGLGLLVYFLVSPVTWFLIPAETKKMLEADGRVSPVQPMMGLWILLPVIGAFVWFPKVQGTLNEYWGSKGATAA